MILTLEDVKAVLAPDEPDYESARSLGPDAVALLIELLHSDDTHYATKAASLLGMIGGPEAAQALLDSADEPRLSIRIATAATAVNLDLEPREAILGKLLESDEAIVRKVALESVQLERSDHINDLLRHVSLHDASPEIKALARGIIAP